MKKNSLEYLEKSAAFKKKLRIFLEERSYLEVQTPILVDTPGAEVYLDFFSTTEIKGQNHHQKWLHSSPEIEMKKILATSASRRIYQICSVFRNAESSTNWHKSEFTMLEFYSKEHDFKEFIKDCGLCIQEVCGLASTIKKFHIGDYLKEKFNLSLSDPERFLQDASKQFDYIHASDDLDLVFSKVFNFECESKFQDFEIVLVTGYPSFQLTLANEVQGYSERFEYFVRGVEVANGFHELTGASNTERFSQIHQKRVQIRNKPLPANAADIDQIAGNQVPACGVAMGVDRLFALCHGLASIH